MNTPDSALKKIQRPWFGSRFWAPVLLVLLGGSGIAFEGYQLVETLRQSAAASARAQGDATAREITGFIGREQERLAAFAADAQAEVRMLLSFGDDWPVIDALQRRLQRLFRGAIAFSVTDPDGQPLFEDFEGLVGPVCQASMRSYARAIERGDAVISIPPIHPVPGAYHFDLITPWRLDSGASGLFFVSFSPARIAELLAAAELASGNRMVLVNQDDPTLIEVSSVGARDALRGNFRLTPEQLGPQHYAQDLAGTHWRLVVVPNSDGLTAAVREVVLVTALLIIGLILISIALLVLIRREEQENSSLFVRSLQSSVGRQRAILQSMVDGLVTINAAGEIHDVNQAITTLFGYEPSELIGRNVAVLMPGPLQSEQDNFIENYLHTGDSKILGKGREVVGRHKDGSLFPVLLALGESKEGDEPMFVGILHDMTAYNEAQRKIVAQAVEIQRSHQELDQISRITSNPLQRIAALGEAIGARDVAQLDGNAKQQLRTLTDQARDASDLVKGFVDYTRVGQSEHRGPVDLEKVLADVRKDLAARIDAQGATIEIEALGQVLGDPKQLHQVFWNLVDNALKFADPGRPLKITITVEPAGSDPKDVTIRVTDNGIGIPEASLDRVFEAFYRVEPKAQVAGAGLGLSFCRKIVEAAGGRITVHSELGQGTAFLVTLLRPVRR